MRKRWALPHRPRGREQSSRRPSYDRSPSCNWRIDQSNRGECWVAAGCVELTECGNTWSGRKRVEQGLHAYTCEGADENSWQSRQRHTVLSPTLGLLHPPRTHWHRCSRPSRNASTHHDGSMQRQDVGRHFLLSCSRPAATRELGLLQSDALPSMQTTRLCCWHECA